MHFETHYGTKTNGSINNIDILILRLNKIRNGNLSNTQSALMMIKSFTFVNISSFVFKFDVIFMTIFLAYVTDMKMMKII